MFSTFLGLPDGYGKPEQWLAILGGAALGAFLFGLFAQMLCRAMTKKKLPPVPTTIIRIVGGLAVGLLTAMWMWQGGGWGPGGNGPGNTNGNGNGPSPPQANNTPPDKPGDKPPDKPPDKPAPPPDAGPPPPPQSVLRLEVLTNAALLSLPGAGQPAVDEQREYKVVGDDDPKNLRTLPQMEKIIKDRLAEKPPLLKVDIVTRKDVSPAATSGRVKQLREKIEEIDPKLVVAYPDH